ncbi:hypothetical protein Salat_2577300, partial [Sesamum alatum]
SHSPAEIPPFSLENLLPSSTEYSLGASLSIAPPPGVFAPHFQADCSPSALQQLLVPQSAPLAPRSATLPPLMHEKSYKDALFSTPHSLPHALLPAANLSSEKTIAAFCTAVDSAPATFCTRKNHAAHRLAQMKKLVLSCLA